MLNNVMNKVHQVLNHQHLNQTHGWESQASDMTILETLIAAKEKLSAINFTEKQQQIKAIEQVLSIDENIQEKVQNAITNKLILLKKNGDLKEETLLFIYAYQRQLYAAYGLLLNAYYSQNRFELSLEKIHLILARYLNTIFMMAKSCYFDDQPASFGVWSNVHKVIEVVEDLSLMNRNLFLYEFQMKEMSIAAILKRGFMLDTLQKGNYSQLEIELTDTILEIWSSNPAIESQFKQNEFQFFIQLEKDKRPERIRGGKRHSDCRYWKTTRLVDLMENYLCAADMHRPINIFKQINFATTADILKLFKKLRVDWCVKGYKRQRRIEKRDTQERFLSMYYGLDEVVHHLSGANIQHLQSDSLPESDATRLGFNRFKTIQDSKHGFAINFGEELDAWVVNGTLVGYTTEQDKDVFSVAEIKSVKKQADDTFRVGFEKIAEHADAVDITTVEKNAVLQPIEGYFLDDGENLVELSQFSGLFVEDEKTALAKLIIPTKEYKRGNEYRVTLNGVAYVVLVRKVISMQKDWVYLDISI